MVFEVSSFEDLKQKAWQAVKQGQKCDYDKEWEKDYIDAYFPCTTVWTYENVINIYRNYLSGRTNEAQAKIALADQQQEYQLSQEFFKKVVDSMKAEAAAFKKAGIKYGTVEYKCPICGGTAHATRQPSPDNLAHKVSYWGGCSTCGWTSMN